MATSQLGSHVMDNGLASIRALCHATDPALSDVKAHILHNWDYSANLDYSGVIGKSLGNPTGITQAMISVPAPDGTGRKVTVSPFTIVPNTGSQAPHNLHIALLDDTAGRILAINDVNNDQAIAADNPVDVAQYTIGIAQAAQVP